MTSVQSSGAASQRLTTTSSPWVWNLPPSDVWTCDSACMAGNLREGLQERIDGYKKNKIKSFINSQTIKQQKMSRGQTWRSKYSTLMSSFEPSSSLGWSQTYCGWIFFFQERQYLQVHYSQTVWLSDGISEYVCEFNSTASNPLIARVQLWS